MTIVRVALDVPLPQHFDYRCDDAGVADIGYRIQVPFGRKTVVGIIIGVAEDTEVDPAKLRQAEKILRDIAPLPPDWIALAEFCAGYYHKPIGEVMALGLPPRLRTAKAMPASPEHYVLSQPDTSAASPMRTRHKTRNAVLERLARGPATLEEISAAGKTARAVLRELLAGGIATAVQPVRAKPAFVPGPVLTAGQQQALLAARASAGAFSVQLLFGITGSGKTEVYLRLIADTLEAGGQALVLVPEIGLTPAIEEVFLKRFPGALLSIQTSAMAEMDRARSWLDAHEGRADIVLGTRLAVFSPMPRLALIVVDEEQDASFKQQESLRYSARDLAIVRGRARGVPVLLASATPSLESWQHASSGRYRLMTLVQRAHPEAALPEIQLIDLRQSPAKDGFAQPVIEALAQGLTRGEQSMVFLNRRGYAPVLACPSCGWVSGCPRCSAHLVVHLGQGLLRCHHCGHAERVPRSCPDCGTLDLQPFGRGTQRVEATLEACFPAAKIVRIDSDSTRNRGELKNLLAAAKGGEADILVGTQILAKGHHFERLTLVCTLNADSGLFASDYRASERLFAQLQQVTGRAGRAGAAGAALVQTRYPHHPLYQALRRHDYTAFAASVLAERQHAGFPPFVFEAALRAEAAESEEALLFLHSAVALAPPLPAGLTLYDPAPMSLARMAGMSRAQVVLQSPSRPLLQGFLRGWSASLYAMRARGARWHLDVDPIEF